MGHLECVGGDSLVRSVTVLRDRCSLQGDRVACFFTRSALAPLLVRGSWDFDLRPLNVRPVAFATPMQRYGVNPSGHPSLFVRSKCQYYYNPSKPQWVRIDKALSRLPGWPSKLPDEVSSIQIRVPSAEDMSSRGSHVPLGARTVFGFWNRIDYIIAGAGNRSVRKAGKTARRHFRAKFGDHAERLWAAAEQRGARDPGAKLLCWGRVRMDMACMLYHREVSDLGPWTTREVGFDATPGGRREILALVEVMVRFKSPAEDCPPDLEEYRYPAVNLGHRIISSIGDAEGLSMHDKEAMLNYVWSVEIRFHMQGRIFCSNHWISSPNCRPSNQLKQIHYYCI